MPLSLDQLALHQPALVTRLSDAPAESATVRRLYEMGFDEGVDVELLHRGPLGGDPLAVRVGNITLAMRSAQAALVRVTLAHTETAAETVEAAA